MQLYTPGRWASGTPEDLASMRGAAFTCWVFFMRRSGSRLPAHHVGEPEAGEVVPFDRYGEQDRFYVRLFHPGQFTDWSRELHGARLARAAASVQLLVGEEWDATAKAHRVQTWLCVASVERGHEILRRMVRAERKSPRV